MTGPPVRGGTAIIINKLITFEKINLACLNKLKNLEVTIIKLKLKNNKNLYIISAYSPGDARANFSNDLQEIFFELKLSDTINYYILAGDLNARHNLWNDNRINTRGAVLAEWLEDNQIQFRTLLSGPEMATYPAGDSYLVIAIHDARVKITNSINNTCRVYPYDSDHKAILLKIQIENMDSFLFTPSETNKLNFNKTNWKKFNTNLQKIDIKIPNNINLKNSEIENYIS